MTAKIDNELRDRMIKQKTLEKPLELFKEKKNEKKDAKPVATFSTKRSKTKRKYKFKKRKLSN